MIPLPTAWHQAWMSRRHRRFPRTFRLLLPLVWLSVSVLLVAGPTTEAQRPAWQCHPGQVTDLRVSASAGEVTLFWTAPRGGSGVITHWQYSLDGEVWRDLPDSDGDTRSLRLEDLPADTYRFRVRAMNGHKAGPNSNPAPLQLASTPTPTSSASGLSADTGVTVGSPATATPRPNPPGNPSPTPTATATTASRGPGGNPSPTATATATATATNTSTPTNTNTPTATATATTSSPTAPGQVTGLAGTPGPNAGQVTLNWNTVSGATSYDYFTQKQGGGGGGWQAMSGSTGSTSTYTYQVPDVRDYELQWHFRIRGRNSVGAGTPSASLWIAPKQGTATATATAAPRR